MIKVDFSSIVNQLNLTAKSLNLKDVISFFSGDAMIEVAKVAKEFAPYSNVAVFSTENSFFKYGVSLTEKLKAEFLRPTSVIIKKDKRFNVDGVSSLFNLSEEVRFLVVTDSALIESGAYFSTVRNIPMLVIVNSFNFSEILNYTFIIDNANNVDEFRCYGRRFIFIDSSRFDFSNAVNGIYAVGGKLSALIDYKINAVLTGKEQNEKLIELIERAVNSLVELESVNNNDKLLKILLSALLVEFGGAVDDGEILKCSSAKSSAMLLESTTLACAVAEFFSAKKIMDCYQELFNATDYGERIPDYNDIANHISRISGVSQAVVSKNIIFKLSILNDKSGGKRRLVGAMKNQVLLLNNKFIAIERLYRKESGKMAYRKKGIKKCVELSGYAEKYINGMTLFNEFGFFVK